MVSSTNIQAPLHVLGLREAAEAIARGELSSEALTRALLERIAEHEQKVQAFEWIDPDRALGLARQADAKRRSGQALGPLHGIGIGIKDIVATAGIPTRMGSVIYKDNIPQTSAVVVQRLEAAGAFVLGKTVTTEFAYFTPGKTRNPWHPDHTPGGSSSGSAAGVALGFFPAAIGTQTNGSVIRPAAFCGVVGYKPSAGTISLEAIHPFSPSLDQVGVFGRSVADAALVASVLENAPVAGKPKAIPPALAPLSTAPRLAAVRSPVWNLAEPYAKEHFLDRIQRLQAAGAIVEQVDLPPAFDAAHAVHRTIMVAEGARVFADLQSCERHRLSARLNALIDEGLTIPEAALNEALAQQKQLCAQMDEFAAGFDAIITPSTLGQAPKDLTQTGDPAFCTIWSLCGVPAITLPAGTGPQGLPLGLQVIAPRNADARLLAAAQWCAPNVR